MLEAARCSRRAGWLDDGRFGDGLAQAAAAAADRRSLLAVPLPESSGHGVGLVLVFFEGEEVFDDEQLALAERVAGAARGALERSELYERERRSRALAQRLARAGRELAGELDPDNVLDQAVRHAVQLVGVEGASMRMLENDEVVVRAATGAGEDEAIGTRAPSTGFLVGDIVQTRSTRAVADVRTDRRLGEADPMLAAGYLAYLGVPMIGPGGVGPGDPGGLRRANARVARGGRRGAARARRQRRRGPRERRALPGRQPRAAAQRGDPRERRRRDRRGRP